MIGYKSFFFDKTTTEVSRFEHPLHAIATPQLRAFSLVEILVSVGIIAVLIVLSTASVGGIKANGLRSKSISNLRTLAQAHIAYANDNGGVYPVTSQTIAGMNQVESKIAVSLASKYGPRYLFSTNVHPLGRGQADYLETVDVFYSPFCKKYKQPKKNDFYVEGTTPYIGYQFYYFNRNDPVFKATDPEPLPNLFSERMSDGVTAPLYSDICWESKTAAGFDDKVCHVVFIDGHVAAFPADKISKVTPWSNRVLVFLGKKEL